jgi:hypothetical protein
MLVSDCFIMTCMYNVVHLMHICVCINECLCEYTYTCMYIHIYLLQYIVIHSNKMCVCVRVCMCESACVGDDEQIHNEIHSYCQIYRKSAIFKNLHENNRQRI